MPKKQKRKKIALIYSLEHVLEMVTTAFVSGLKTVAGERLDDKWLEKFKAEDYLIDSK